MIAFANKTARSVVNNGARPARSGTATPKKAPARKRRNGDSVDQLAAALIRGCCGIGESTRRYLKLPVPITEGRGNVLSRVVFTIDKHPQPWSDEFVMKRGLYLTIAGTFTGYENQYALVDGKGRVAAQINPLPMRDDHSRAPRADLWPDVQRLCCEILDDGDATLAFYGSLPRDAVAAASRTAIDLVGRYRRVPELTLDDNIVRYPFFSPGLHIAPFRGESGQLLIVAIGPDGALDGMFPVTELSDWAMYAERAALPRRVRFAAHVDEQHMCRADDRSLVDTHAFLTDYSNLSQSDERSVIRVCPWRGRVNRRAFVLAVTDRLGNAKSFEEVPDVTPESASTALAFLRDIREEELDDDRRARPSTLYDPALREEFAAADAEAEQ